MISKKSRTTTGLMGRNGKAVSFDDDKKKKKKKGTEPKLSGKDKRKANKNRRNKTINANIPDYRNYKED